MKAPSPVSTTPPSSTGPARNGRLLRRALATASARWVGVGVAYFGITAALLGPSVVTRCQTTIAGGPGDNTAGHIWQTWNYLRLGVGPLARHTPLFHAPSGAALFQPHQVTSLLLIVPMWIFGHAVGPVCSFNIAVIAGLWLNAILAFGLVRWLTGRSTVAFFAGYAFAFTPFHIYKAYGHLGYVSTWAFPLIVWALLAFWVAPTVRRSSLVAGSILLAFYTDGYYLLLVPVTVTAFVIGAVVHDRASSTAWPWSKLRILLLAGGLVALGSLPIGYTLATQGGEIGSVLNRPKADLYVYGARPWEWVLPARTHPFFAPRIGGWQDRHLHQSNYSEQTLFPGITVLLLAALAVVLYVRRRGNGVDHPTWKEPRALAVATMTPVVMASALFSLPPTIHHVPMPSDLVYSVAHLWRVYSRFFIPLDLALVILASVALLRLTDRSRRRELAVVMSLLPVLAFELLAAGRPPTWSYREKTPTVYRWLARQRPVGSLLAEYPLLPSPSGALASYLTYQPVHSHPLFNGALPDTLAGNVETSLFGLGDPQTVPILRRMGVKTVIVHPDSYSQMVHTSVDLASPPRGLERTFSSPDATGYKLSEGQAADAMLRLGDGFYAAEGDGWFSSRWMGTSATADVLELEESHGPFVVSFTASPFIVSRELTVSQGDAVLWRGVVDKPTVVSFVMPAAGPIRLIASPGARRISDVVVGSSDWRVVALYVSRLSVATNR